MEINMSTVYNPFDSDYLDRRQQERDECALGLTETHNAVPLELAAGSRREMLMDELDHLKNRKPPEPLPDGLAQNQASNNARRRVVPLWSGPTTQEPLLGANRGDSTDMSTRMAPDTAHTLSRLLRQQGNEKAAAEVERTQGLRW